MTVPGRPHDVARREVYRPAPRGGAADAASSERGTLAWALAGHIVLVGMLSAVWHPAAEPALPLEATPVEIVPISSLQSVTAAPRPSAKAAPQATREPAEPDPGEAPRIEAPPVQTGIEPIEMPVPELKAQPAERQPVDAAPKAKPAPKPELAKSEAPLPSPAREEAAENVKASPRPKVERPSKPAEESRVADVRSATSKAPSPVPDASALKVSKPAAAAPPAKRAPKRLDAQELASLLDKSLPKANRKPLEVSDLADTIERAQPKAAKLDARATATLIHAIQAQIYPCWNPPVGGKVDGPIKVVLAAEFGRDGSPARLPRIVDVESSDTSYGCLVAESARRAVMRCAPLKLPAELYDAWRNVELVFDPSEVT